MVEKNTCVDCGKEILDLHKRKCEECAKKPKKKHLDNIGIITKYRSSIIVINNNIESLMIKINKELERLNSLNEKFILNEPNQKLLKLKMGELVLFKEKLMLVWKQVKEKSLEY